VQPVFEAGHIIGNGGHSPGFAVTDEITVVKRNITANILSTE